MTAVRVKAARRWLPRRPYGRRALVLVTFAVPFALVAAVGLAAHWVAPGPAWQLGLSAFAPYLMLGAPVAGVLLAVAGHRGEALVAAALTVACVFTQLPLFGASEAGSGPHATVMTFNMKLGSADPTQIVSAARRHRVDVLMLEELTPYAAARLADAGLNTLFPYRATEVARGPLGTGLWSRTPLIDVTRHDEFSFHFVSASTRLPGMTDSTTLVALHIGGPWPDSSRWRMDMALLPGVLRSYATSGRVIVGGDFNATPDVKQFRRVLSVGYADAAEQAGAGYTPTWPADRWYPPLITIDHVLLRGAIAHTADTVHIDGSDHRALLVSTTAGSRT